MAVSASAAQAASWLDNGTAITTNTPINARAETEGVLLTHSGPNAVEILCTEIKFVNAVLTPAGGATGKIHFQSPTGCITKINGVTINKCKPKSEGAAVAGLIETKALTGTQILVGGEQFFELEPVAAPTFVVLELGTGECAIGNSVEINGKVLLRDCQKEGLVDKIEHLFEEERVGSTLTFGGNAANIDGSAFGFLPSGHTFAGHV